MRLAIGAVSGVLFTLGGGLSTVWGTLDCDLSYNHGVANLFSSVLGDILKLDEEEGVCACHTLLLGDF